MGGPTRSSAESESITTRCGAKASIVLLRYVEMFGEMKRGVTVLKMRGSPHDKGIREVTIDREGMHVLQPFKNVTGILAGTPVHLSPGDIERIWSQLDTDSDGA